jgi:hypothetical protein
MSIDANCDVGEQPTNSPRSVSRGLNLQSVFFGIDSLYLVMEYPHADVFDFWMSYVRETPNARLRAGVVVEDYVIKNGGNGYKLSVWDGDARLYMTDRVEDNTQNEGEDGQGMGLMLQLGPQWLQQCADIVCPEVLIDNVFAQFNYFQVRQPQNYPVRLNRLDIALDIAGLRVDDFSIDEWRRGWVGYAHPRQLHFSPLTRGIEGFAIGSSEGVVRFKVYDKVLQSIQKGISRFWRSVWNVSEETSVDVARFEWSIRVYEARFVGMRYLTDFTFEGFMDLLNYVSLKWGRLCIPEDDDANRSRWEIAPLWAEVRRLITEWTFNYDGVAKREYDFRPDLKTDYIKSFAGWAGGFMARLGIERKANNPSSLDEVVDFLRSEGVSLPEKAKQKWELFTRLLGGGR